MEEKEIACQAAMRPIMDSMFVLSGKWKLLIILALTFRNCGFVELEKQVKGISPRMLSKELKHLVENKLVTRKNHIDNPSKVEYALSEHGQSLKPVILALRDWGKLHRSVIFDRA